MTFLTAWVALLIQVQVSQTFQEGKSLKNHTFLKVKTGVLVMRWLIFPFSALTDHALTDNEYRYNVGEGYEFFEILHPEELSYTFKINPAAFSQPWNMSLTEYKMILADPPCGCASFRNADEVEGQIVLIGKRFFTWKTVQIIYIWFITERGECSFVSKTIKAQEAGALAAIISDIDEKQDELFVSMVDDTTERTVKIPSAYLLGKNG